MTKNSSLLKFNSPVQITNENNSSGDKSSSISLPSLTKNSKHGHSSPSSKTQEMLNLMFPPQTWRTCNNQQWMQSVSSAPATPLEVTNLIESFDRSLKDRHANPSGMCPVREELYKDCLDEVIRQVTIQCAERGSLLLRIRDEMRMTVDAYASLYESSVAFGLRKALAARHEKEEYIARVEILEKNKAVLENKVEELKLQLKDAKKKEEPRTEEEVSKYKKELQKLKAKNEQITLALEKFLVQSQSELATETLKTKYGSDQ